jgi:DNA-binding transcriptional LysR family regulator
MNIRWVVLFAAVAEEGSFTRAATRLSVAQPWVSAQIRKLEFELDVKLLERTKAGVELTPEGRALLPFALQVAEGSRRFRDLARTLGDVRSKIVRIGSHIPMLDVPPLRRLNNEFARRYPQFSLRADSGTTPELLAALRQSQLDLIVGLSPIGGDGDEFAMVALNDVKPYLLMPRSGSFSPDSDLSGRTIMTPNPEIHPAFYGPLLASLKAAGATLRSVPEADRRAMEHHARTWSAAVVMIEGSSADYENDRDLVATPLGKIGASNLLIRVAGRELGRAASRYWAMAEAAAARGAERI